VVQRFGGANISDLVKTLKVARDETIFIAISEAMNTHESFFFRDNGPFDSFQADLLPQFLHRRAEQRKFRSWCAAFFSGQEPYSLAMVLNEEADMLKDWQVDIIATDISHSVLDQAREGLCSKSEVQRGLSAQRLDRHYR